MIKNKLFLSALVLVIAGVAVYFVTQEKDDAQKNFIEYISSEGLNRIEISKNGKILTLSKDEALGQWLIIQQDQPNLIADASKIVKLLDSLNESVIFQKVTSKPEHYKKFDIQGDEATVVKIYKDNNIHQTVYLGKAKDDSSQFVRKNESPAVYLISSKIQTDTDVDPWTHKKLVLEKESLKNITYNTKDHKVVELSYDSGENKFNLLGNMPEKKQLKKLPSLAQQFTEIRWKGLLKQKEAPKGKRLTKHNVTLNDDTKLTYSFLEAKTNKKKDAPKQYFLSLEVETKSDAASPQISYLANLAKDYLFELPSMPTSTFQKKWDDFFEAVKEEKKEASKAEEAAASSKKAEVSQ